MPTAAVTNENVWGIFCGLGLMSPLKSLQHLSCSIGIAHALARCLGFTATCTAVPLVGIPRMQCWSCHPPSKLRSLLSWVLRNHPFRQWRCVLHLRWYFLVAPLIQYALGASKRRNRSLSLLRIQCRRVCWRRVAVARRSHRWHPCPRSWLS